MFFGQSVTFGLQFFKVGAGLLQHLLLHGTRRFLFFPQLAVLLALGFGAIRFLIQALQFHARHG